MPKSWTFQTLIDVLASRNEAPALIEVQGETLRTLSCASLAERVRALAGGLVRLGVAPGEPVALIAPNGPEWVTARLALGAAGALAVALDDLTTTSELSTALADSGCRRVVTSARHVSTLRTIDPRLDLIILGKDPVPEGTRSWTALLAEPAGALPSLAADAPAMLVYTSGTTGAPKSFVLTYANVWANLSALVAQGLVRLGDHVLLPLPLHHVYPLVIGLLTPLCSGAATVFPEAVAGPQIMQAVRLAEVSAIVGVPRLYAAMLAGVEARVAAAGIISRVLFHGLLGLSIQLRRRCAIDLGRWLFRRVRMRIGSKVRLLVSGGAHFDPEVLWPLVGLGFEVRSGYGLAETASIFTGNLPACERLESEGQPFQGGEIRIAEPDEEGVGEIQLRGPNVFAGYRNNVEANRDAFSAGGWFRTGDLGRLDADGFLYVTGRIKETIVLGGGKKVQPEELEKLYGSSPYIRELAVLEREGALVALVVPDFDAIRSGPSARIDDTIRVALASQAQNLRSYQRLAGFALVRDPLPRTRLGKYQRFQLPALYEQAVAGSSMPAPRPLSPEDAELLAQPRARRVYELIKARYPGKPVSLDANPMLDLGIDSLEWVALALTLEERLGVRLAEGDVTTAVTLRDLLRIAVRSVEVAEPHAEATAGGPLTPAEAHWLAPTGLALTLLGLLAYGINWLAMRLMFRLRIEGAEHLPAHGPYVLVPNHASDLDPLLLAAALSYGRARRLYWGGEVTRLFSRPWLYPLLRALHIFPLDDRAPARSLALAKAVLAGGKDLVWFPEAWRSPDGRLQRFLPGIGWLLERARVTAVPVYIAGSFEAMPRDRVLPRPRSIRIWIGEPLVPDALAALGPSAEAQHHRIVNALQQAVASLETRASGGAKTLTKLN